MLAALNAELKGQASDNFTGAEQITISNQNYGVGNFQSSLVSLGNATVEPSEFFTDDLIRAGNINKSLWFKFEIASNRDVNIVLKQKDSAILQSDVGLTIYENPNNWAGKHSLCAGLPPITKFGSVGNTCLKSGEYYIQVCARARVIDSIFIELEVKLPNEPLSDPYNPIEVKFAGGSTSWNLYGIAGCAYVIAPDFFPFQNTKQFNRAVNWRFKYNSPEEYLSMGLSFNAAQWGKIPLLVILKEEPNVPMKNWTVVDTTSLISSYYFQSFGCLGNKTLDTGTYRAVLLYKDIDIVSGSLTHGLVRNGKSHDNSIPSQLEASHKLGEIKNRNIKDTFHCNSSIENACPNLRKDAFYFVDQTDSFFYNLQDWYTFKVSKYEILNLRMASNQSFFRMLVYEGDITQSCNVTLKERRTKYGNNEYCLQPGVYSLRILRYNQSGSPSLATINYELIAKIVAITNSNNLYTDSLVPQVLPDIAATNIFTITSSKNFFSTNDQKIYTGQDTLYGNMIYREFHYVNKAIPIEIFSTYNVSLFKGRKSLSNATEYITRWARSKTFYCSNLDTGWYTLIQVYGSYNNPRECISVEDPQDQIQFQNTQGCQNLTMGTIQNPDLLNNGAPILADSKNIDGVVYPETRFLEVKNRCVQCFADAPKYRAFLNEKCFAVSDYEGLGVIEFELAQEFDLQFDRVNSPVYLIRGSLKANPGKLYDSTAYLAPCSWANSFCRLQPGKYSVVVFSAYPNPNFSIKFAFIPNRSAANNEIEKAEDIGQVIGTKKSKPYLFNCLIFNDTSYSIQNIGIGKPFTTQVEYPLDYRGLIYYTFHVIGNGRLTIDPVDEVFLLRIDEGFDYQAAMNNPQMRDSILNHSKHIRYGNNTSSDIRLDIARCGRTDFLVVSRNMYWQILSQNRQLEVNFTPNSIQPSVHDFCNTAQLLDINSTGSFSETFDTRCTSMGEGFGEDGNNLACLPDDVEFGTFWAKVKIDPGFAYDASFKLSALPGVSFANQVKYRILYGSCNGLNPGPCLSSLNTYIGFDCMKPGEYYFQIAVPKEFNNPSQITEFLKLDVQVVPPKSGTCKPFEPHRPLASFNYKGNCELDSVRFQNYSSQGSEIEYLWDFGDGSTSTAKDPVHWYNFTGAYQDYSVKLWVTNKTYNLQDSFNRFLRVWKDPLAMDLNFVDTLVLCNTELYIEASNNLPDVFFYYSINTVGDTVIDNKLLERFKTPSKVNFVMFTAGCYVDSTVNINIDQNLNLLPEDTLICGLKDIVLDAAPYQIVSWLPGFINNPKLTVTKAGEYIVITQDSGCQKLDTINVREYRRAFDPPVDTVLCNVDSFEISLPSHLSQILWYDQKTDYSRWVSQNGDYAVRAQWDDCQLFDTARVRFSDIRNPILDIIDSLCVETGIEIGTDEFASSYLWNTGETTPKIWVYDQGVYKLTVVAGNCSNEDSIKVIRYPLTSPMMSDTSACGDFLIHLDAGIGTNYVWWPLGSTSQTVSVRDSGWYGFFKINKYGCEERDTVHVIENCGPYFLMPNSFTPNGDGKNDRLVWAHPDVTEFDLIIFNRWGEVIFESHDPSGYWDGMYKGSALPDGNYYYQVTYGGFDWTGAYFRRNDKGFILLMN